MTDVSLDAVDRSIVNTLQGGFPISERPFAEVADALGIAEDELLQRLERLQDCKCMSRFGPMYNAERLGGDVTLAALTVPEDRYDQVAELVNAHAEVAHNYTRTHQYNMWFVVAADRPERIADVLGEIERETGLQVLNLPKLEEFFIGLKVDV